MRKLGVNLVMQLTPDQRATLKTAAGDQALSTWVRNLAVNTAEASFDPSGREFALPSSADPFAVSVRVKRRRVSRPAARQLP
jgi:hypothetical protein